MDNDLLNKGLKRVWRSWNWSFMFAVVILVVVFVTAITIEVGNKGTEIESEEDVKYFDLYMSPNIAAGMRSYTATISNNQEYTILEMKLLFEGSNLQSPEDITQDYPGKSLDAGGENTYSVLIPEGADSVEFVLDGDELRNIANINLYVQNANGTHEWSSTDIGKDETIILTLEDLQASGYGSYTVAVKHEDGRWSVDYDLSISVSFSPLKLLESTTDRLEPKESRTFDFIVNLDQSQISEIKFIVTASAFVKGGTTIDMIVEYKYDGSAPKKTCVIHQVDNGSEPWGPVDITGTASAISYTIAIFSGFVLWARLTFTEAVKPKFIGPAHCFISLVALVLAIDHALIALQKSWPWTSPGMVFSYAAITLLFIFTVFSFFDVEGQKVLGKRKWRWVHIILTVLLLLLIVFHFGLMGDHLGFLK